MDYITTHDLRLPRLTLGTVQLGLRYGIANKIGKPDEVHSHELLQQAEQLGITCFDTAAGYGDAEAVLGRYFRQFPDPDRQIVTKFKLDPAVGTTEAELEKAVRSQLEQSLLHLGIQRIPIYLMHNADDLHRHQDRLVAVLDRLVREGLIGLMGVSVYRAADLDRMLQYELFRATQIPINLFDQRLIRSGHLARLKEKGIIVFARSVFLQGLFFMDPDSLPSALAHAAPLLQALRQLADDEKLPIAQLALSFVRDLPGITSLVIGAETAEQVAENVRLCAGWPLSDAGRVTADRLFREVPEVVVNPSLWQG
ncbi:MAG: aldo/keto reductase [Bacillota bacterium]|nr:aldo/keto reductase [Bacillota bacterium]